MAGRQPSPTVAAALVHGDFRMGNLIVDEAGLAAVLDWELVHTGEAVRGPGLVLHQGLAVRRTRGLGAGGLGTVESFLAAYERPAALNSTGRIPLVAGRWRLCDGASSAASRPTGTCPVRLRRSSWPRSAVGSAKRSWTC